jgi:hypothetical protein
MIGEVETNADDVLLDEISEEEHTLTVANVMEYAVYLHDAEGYYVFNDEQLQRISTQKLRGLDGEPTDEKIEGALQTAAAEYVNWLLDLDNSEGTQPPLTPSEAPRGVEPGEPRQARRGGWADRTHNLAAGYKSQVNDGPVMDHDEAAPEPVEELEEMTLEFPSD